MLISVLGLSQNQSPDRKADEAAIRELIARPQQQIKRTDDSIFWSGAFPRPQVGSQRIEPFPSVQAQKRKNETVTVHPERIELAGSGDMAYEFSYANLEYNVEAPAPQHIAFQSGLLRVWKKVHGEWRVAAMFIRPLDVPFSNPAPSR
ncbi:MAG: hypothetical protein ACJ746_15555 [Bryobacteraceae bacterium]